MKRHLNINKFLMVGVALFCLFFTVNNVEAKEFICYYRDPMYDNAAKWKISSPYIKVHYKNGKATVQWYDHSTNSELGNKLYYAVNDAYEEISPKSGSQLADSDFSNGCPSKIDRMTLPGYDNGNVIFDVFKKGTEEYNLFYDQTLYETGNKYSKELKSIYNSGSMKTKKCYQSGLNFDPSNEYSQAHFCWKPTFVQEDGVSNGTTNGGTSNNTNKEYITCPYASDGHVSTDAGNVKPYLIIKYNKSTKKTEATSELANTSATINVHIDFSKLNDKCPNTVYTDANYENIYSNISEVPDKRDAHMFGLIKKVSLTKKPTDTGKTGCDLIGDRTLGIVKKLYALIRFLVPAIIIVLSVLDFTGIVLSGETEKMEKAKKRFVIRIVSGMLVLFVPAILEMLLRLAGIIESNEDLVNAACNLF